MIAFAGLGLAANLANFAPPAVIGWMAGVRVTCLGSLVIAYFVRSVR